MKAIIKIKGNRKLNARGLAHIIDMEKARTIGCDEIIIESDDDDNIILLDWNLPSGPAGIPDKEEFSKYLSNKSKKGWRLSFSWGYGIFRKLKPTKIK